MRVALLIFWFLSTQCFASDPYPINPNVDIQHYQFDIDLYPEESRIEVVAKIKIAVAGEQLQQFYLDLDDLNDDGTGMKISSVDYNGKSITIAHSEDRILIDLPESLDRGAKFELTLGYTGQPKDGLIISQTDKKAITVFGDNWPNRAHYWLSTVDHPSDKATVDFSVSAPKNYQVIATGLLQKEESVAGKRVKYYWSNSVPIPTKVMVMGAAEFEVFEQGDVAGVPVSTWLYKGDAKKGLPLFNETVNILKFFSDWIGEYPYAKLAHVQSTTRYGGMENAGNIFYYEDITNSEEPRDRLIAHETAHQWFGNSASEKDWHHVWLSEGFATYMTMIYVENEKGRDEMKADLEKARTRVVDFNNKSPKSSVIDTTIVELTKLLNANSYQKGAWFLHMLRHKVGDEVFQASIREYYTSYRNSNALTDDFRAIVEKNSGMELEGFFTTWLYRSDLPKLEWSWRQKPGDQRASIRIKQAQMRAFEGLEVEVAIYVNNRDEPLIKTMPITSTSKEYSYLVNGAVDRVEIDPERKLLFEGQYTKDGRQ
ncbi:MAG: M1 family metallopeptidase [Cyclobacteriaceae bacterium]